MANYGCTIEWSREGAAFTDLQYKRAHQWRFDGGAVVPGSSSPHSVRLPFSDPAAVDPEEALVASVASCHMLWFLSLAAEQGFVVDSYTDSAEAHMGPVGFGRQAITDIVLRPQVSFSGPHLPDQAAYDALHHVAHERCYIANSLRSAVRVEGSWRAA
ncbi:OsmC family peroxiredoxin [Ramlibacter sp. G-1-2-2]|uniref:OsmC family peroxiredoxin n=1 Tax=Ramlibacter agri TaxID=2728837 RepID=A0A848H354_9BURK|nr:OsmC family protein [Ramlibacter agri]NML44917.1 OsmC family peroxiredoxin [Ramlibacter agri]